MHFEALSGGGIDTSTFPFHTEPGESAISGRPWRTLRLGCTHCVGVCARVFPSGATSEHASKVCLLGGKGCGSQGGMICSPEGAFPTQRRGP